MAKFNFKNHKTLISSVVGVTAFSSLFLSKKFRKLVFKQKHYSEIAKQELAEYEKKVGKK